MRQNSFQTFLISVVLLAIALVVSIGTEPRLQAQQPTEAKPTTSETKPSAVEAKGSDDAPRQTDAPPTAKEEHKKQVVTVGMLVLVGVVLIGLMLIGMTVAWGSRVRKLARKPLPAQSPVDELWYLKAKKNPGNETAGKGAASGGENAPDSDLPESS